MITKKFSKSYDEALTQAYLFQSLWIDNQAVFTVFLTPTGVCDRVSFGVLYIYKHITSLE